MGIFADGTIGTCSCTDDRLQGNIRDSNFDLEKLWLNDSKLIEIRQLERQKYEPCPSCKHNEYCRPCRSFNLSNDKQAPQSCPAVRDYKELIKSLEEPIALRKALHHNMIL